MSSETLLVDDDGFVCLVAPDTYRGFVSENWTLDEILSHFVAQMNRASLSEGDPTYALTLTPDEAEDAEIGEVQSVPWF